MARTVVYEDPLLAAHYADEIKANPPDTRAARRAARAHAAVKAKAADAPAAGDKVALAKADTKDSYLSKLAKYVPAATIAAVTLLFAAFEPDGRTVWVVVALGAVANIVYLLSVAVMSTSSQPRWFLYVLAAAAFVGWAVAVIDPVAQKAGITSANAETQKFAVLAMTAFIIPAVNPILNHLDVRFRSPPAKPPA